MTIITVYRKIGSTKTVLQCWPSSLDNWETLSIKIVVSTKDNVMLFSHTKTISNTILVIYKNVMAGLRHITLGYKVGSTPMGRHLGEIKIHKANRSGNTPGNWGFGSYLACGGKMRQSLVAVKTANFLLPQVFFFTAACDARFCVAGWQVQHFKA